MNEALLLNAYRHHQSGNLAEAARLYRDILRADPKHFDALCMLGHLYFQRGEKDEASRAADAALLCEPRLPNAHYNLGCLLQGLERHRDAIESFGKALALKPQYFEALVNRGTSLLALEMTAEALDVFDRALAIRPKEAGLWNNRGNALMWLGRCDDAVESYDRALALKPNYGDAWGSRGNALLALGRNEDALASYDKALAMPPGTASLWTNRGIAQYRLKQFAASLASLDAATMFDANRADTLFHRGNALSELKRYDEALTALDASLTIKPDEPDTLVSRGVALAALARQDEALASYDQALRLKEDCVEALINRGTLLFGLKRFEEATRDYERALALDPDIPYIRGNLAVYKLLSCDWRTLENDRARIAAGLLTGKPVILPFPNLALSRSMMDQLQCARIWAKRELPSVPALWRGERYRHGRIRIAYLSADFHGHATAFLMAGVFEHHDKARFETIAISYGPDDGSPMRERLRNSFDRFLDVRGQSDFEIATLLRQMETDIVIDLKGYTEDSRPGILAHRPAPVQAQYLGYPGSMGSDHVDYIVADKIVAPEHQSIYFDEKIAYLPDSYQCNDSKRRVADATPTRVSVGLPEAGFVFCSFNNSYKIMPDIFAAWMRLLRKNEKAVLWLLQHDATAVENLRREAEAAGIDSGRLIFAPFMPNEEHLARMRLADLFLDTLPYNAHTTASDALWVGLPVLTIRGKTFAGRVCASLLHAADLPEMVTDCLEAYETLASRLASDAEALAAIKSKLARNRGRMPLFDTARFTRHLETLYVQMWRRAERGDQPAAMDCAAVPERAEA